MEDVNQTTKFAAFRQLHDRSGAFVIPNPWDAGSARILAALGFEALATTSAGFAFSIGQRDSFGGLTRDQVLDNARAIVEATDLPVTADLEEGFGSAPEACAETIKAAAGVGLVGGSIEDATGEACAPIFDFNHAVDRVAAASEAAHGLPFVLTARAENHIYGRPDLEDTIRRLQAYAKAGAHVLYAPGLPSLDDIRAVCAEVDKPVNVVMGLSGASFSVTQLQEAGVKRISVGGSFARAALGAFVRAAREVKDHGTFTYAADAIPDQEAASYMRPIKRAP
ncbi:MAG: isocitrate lyase/PEP mutase family protein [Hyphomicrobiaceae bacterium]